MPSACEENLNPSAKTTGAAAQGVPEVVPEAVPEAVPDAVQIAVTDVQEQVTTDVQAQEATAHEVSQPSDERPPSPEGEPTDPAWDAGAELNRYLLCQSTYVCSHIQGLSNVCFYSLFPLIPADEHCRVQCMRERVASRLVVAVPFLTFNMYRLTEFYFSIGHAHTCVHT
jgi:hypothetical protein